MTAVPRLHELAQSDGELLAAVANGNLEALGKLFDRHARELERYLARLGIAPSDVDDLVQATFLDVVRAAPRFDARLPARAWLFGVASIMVRRQRRSLGRTMARIAAWAGMGQGAAPPTPAELFEGEQTTQQISRAIERLSPKKREVFVLVTLEGLSGEQVALSLGIPVKTVWTRLHHARLELRAALAEAAP